MINQSLFLNQANSYHSGHAEHDGARGRGHQAHARGPGRHLGHQRQQAGLQVERKPQHRKGLRQVHAPPLGTHAQILSNNEGICNV